MFAIIHASDNGFLRLSIAFGNPYKTEIVKWQNNSNIWDYSNKKLDLISPPIVRNRNGKFAISNPSKG